MIKNIQQVKEGMDSVVDRTHDAVVGVTDRAEHGVESGAERVVDKVHDAGDYVRSGADKASRNAHRRLDHAARAVDRRLLHARSDLSRAAATASDYVAENPGKLLLVAISTGFLLGLLIRSRHSSQ